jgi:NAD(P)-dependent dehydrogenase (short-subunit alcohol dehydrogenase family)
MAGARRVVLVTGAASGIGAAVCRRMAQPGLVLVVHTRRNADGAEAVAQEARARGAEAMVMLGDLADPAVPKYLVAETMSRCGALDVLVSNAGFADRTRFGELTDEAFGRSSDAIEWAFFRLARAAAPHVRMRRNARIVAVSSFVAHSFRPDVTRFPASAAAKAATEALVKSLALELAPDGVTVNAVVPGFIRKDPGAHVAMDPARVARQMESVPLGRQGLPDEVAAAIAFLASAEAAYITGQCLHVDGGLVM